MKEKNKYHLRQAIEKLPHYEPPTFIWDHISLHLDSQMNDQALQEAITQLPTYEPPAFVWEVIEQNLEVTKETASKIRRLYPRIAATAAAVAVLLIGFHFWSPRQAGPSIAYTMVERNINQQINYTSDWNSDESLITEVVALFEESPKANHAPNYEILKEELGELNEAKEGLETIMEKYGMDPDMIQELKEIELERNDVIKQMASLI